MGDDRPHIISDQNTIHFLRRANGKILKAYASDFQALSMNGKMHVEVQNTGYVTADFYVSNDGRLTSARASR